MNEQETIERDNIERANRDELIKLMGEFGITFRPKDFPKWRPTKRQFGCVPGVWERVEIVATDGLLGYFIDEDRQPLLGHIQKFTDHKGDIIEVKPLFSANGAAAPKKRKPKVDKNLALLEKLKTKFGVS